jgi:hypothetical protein
MIKDHHEGYIGWAAYQRNQKRFALNNYDRAGDVKSDRGGKALLSGIMTCGRCGRRLPTREIRRADRSIAGTSQTL